MNKLLRRIPLLRSLLRKIDFLHFQRQWRKLNLHNQTVAMCKFAFQAVRVGKGSYGEIHVESFSEEKDQLIIGNFVSIAPNVMFLLHCNHQTNTLTCFPFRSHLDKIHHPADSLSRGKTTVEDGVWLGYGSIIMDGINIGKGAIVAAGAVVTHDVAPFSVVGGNPARFIKYRIPEEAISELLQLDYSKLNKNLVVKNINEIYHQIKSVDDARNIVDKLTLKE